MTRYFLVALRNVSTASGFPLGIYKTSYQMGHSARDRAARLLSHLLSPATVALAVFCSLTSWRGWEQYWASGLTGIGFYTLVPALALVLLKRRGRMPDVYEPSPRLRGRILLAGTGCYLLGYGVLWLIAAPPTIMWGGASFFSGALLVWLIDRRWKISIHSTGVSGGLLILVVVGGVNVLWPALVAAPLVAWSRLHLRAHTPAQILAGLGLGGILAGVLRPLFL